MTEEFDAPASGVKITDFLGCLLLVQPLREEKDIKTKFGLADAVTANFVALDGNEPGEYADCRIFQRNLQGQLRSKIGTGRYVLGRLARGTEAKYGPGSEPWFLSDPTEADKDTARKHLNNPQPVRAAIASRGFEDKPPF